MEVGGVVLTLRCGIGEGEGTREAGVRMRLGSTCVVDVRLLVRRDFLLLVVRVLEVDSHLVVVVVDVVQLRW